LLGVVFVKSLVVFNPSSNKKEQQALITLLHIIDYCKKTQSTGKLVSPEDMKNYLSTLTDVDWGELRHLMLSNNILKKTEEGDFALVADLNTLTVRDLLNMSPWTLTELKTLADYHGNDSWENTLANKWLAVEDDIKNQFSISINDLLTSKK